MKLRHDPEADALYLAFTNQKVAKTRTISHNRNSAAIDFAVDGNLVGVELLGVRRGIDLSGLPNAQQIRQVLLEHGFSLLEAVSSDGERIDNFLDTIVHGFMGHDLQVAVEGKANFLAAMGLLDYTEILGGLVLGNLNAAAEPKFEAFLPYLGPCYEEVNRRLKSRKGGKKGKGIYSFRSAFTHTYGFKSAGVIRMNVDRHGRCGIEFDEAKGWDFCVQQYFLDFRDGVERLRQKLQTDSTLVSNFVKALGAALYV